MEGANVSAEESRISQLIELRARAYAPYSNFFVACIVESENGGLYPGCNVENVSYPLSQCAEATAISAMVVQGDSKIKQLWILGTGEKLCTPCGACRQKINEFATPDTQIHLCSESEVVKTFSMDNLLPFSFNPSFLLKR